MTPMAIQEVKDGKVVDWLEHVSKADDGAEEIGRRSIEHHDQVGFPEAVGNIANSCHVATPSIGPPAI